MKTTLIPNRTVLLGETRTLTVENAELKYKSSATREGCRLEVRGSERETFTEYHVTATVVGRGVVEGGGCAADDLIGQVAAEMAKRKIQPIQEKFYGRREVRADVLRHRTDAYRRYGLDAEVPVTWIEGMPLGGSDFVGLQIWGIAAHDGEKCVKTVENPATGRGRVWTGCGFEMLHLPGVRGTLPGGELPVGHAAQAQQMFMNVERGLKAHGMVYTDVARTWIYMSRLLEWYGELNRVRNAIYAPAGLGARDGVAFPASTGIQGRMGDEECLVDVLALKRHASASVVAEPVRCSPRQDQSFNYGSAFSRGMTFEIEGKKTVHLSGTASINTAGASTHIGDAECQSLETLMSTAAILEAQGGSLRSITSATLFCKDQASYEAWNRVTRLLQLPDFPKVCVLADVCRQDLLVEMESVAVI